MTEQAVIGLYGDHEPQKGQLGTVQFCTCRSCCGDRAPHPSPDGMLFRHILVLVPLLVMPVPQVAEQAPKVKPDQAPQKGHVTGEEQASVLVSPCGDCCPHPVPEGMSLLHILVLRVLQNPFDPHVTEHVVIALYPDQGPHEGQGFKTQSRVFGCCWGESAPHPVLDGMSFKHILVLVPVCFASGPQVLEQEP